MAVVVIGRPANEDTRQALVLTEDRIGHYPEFRAFFARTFDLDRIGLSEPGFVQASSGLAYALVFIGRSGEPFPAGLEIYAIVPALEPLDDAVVDQHLPRHLTKAPRLENSLDPSSSFQTVMVPLESRRSVSRGGRRS